MKHLSIKNKSILTFFPTVVLNSKPSFALSSSEFLSAVSHELKTPLNAIIGFSDVECMDYVNEINSAALEMNELVHDLLDVGNVAAGNFLVDLSKEIDVPDMVKRAVRLNYDYALRRKIELKLEIAEDVKLIRLDFKRMKQVLANLISNALKYSSQGSDVKIIVKNNLEYLEILVSGQGFGMKPEQVKTAFEKYKTIENPNSGTVDSFSLGLAITKHLVEIQNGSLEVKSEINKGTEIKLRFPYSM